MNKCVAIIGAGTMGRGIAQVFAQSGHQVYLHDVVPAALESAVAQIRKLLDRAVSKEKISAQDAAATVERLHTVSKLANVGPQPLVIEAALENPGEQAFDSRRVSRAFPVDWHLQPPAKPQFKLA